MTEPRMTKAHPVSDWPSQPVWPSSTARSPRDLHHLHHRARIRRSLLPPVYFAALPRLAWRSPFLAAVSWPPGTSEESPKSP